MLEVSMRPGHDSTAHGVGDHKPPVADCGCALPYAIEQCLRSLKAEPRRSPMPPSEGRAPGAVMSAPSQRRAAECGNQRREMPQPGARKAADGRAGHASPRRPGARRKPAHHRLAPSGEAETGAGRPVDARVAKRHEARPGPRARAKCPVRTTMRPDLCQAARHAASGRLIRRAKRRTSYRFGDSSQPRRPRRASSEKAFESRARALGAGSC
jgi:hypothetical protein